MHYFSKYLLPVTYLLRAMWHIRPQHNPANQLYQPLRFGPHSSSSIQLFPFLSLLSSSMLSLVYPVFAVLVGSTLMQFCSHYLVLSSWCDRWISIFSFARPHWGFPSQPSSGLLCNSFLPVYLKYPSKTSALEDVDSLTAIHQDWLYQCLI